MKNNSYIFYKILGCGNRYYILVSILILILCCVSCDNLLDVKADGVKEEKEVFGTEVGIIQSLNGAYFSLGGIYDGGDGGELFGGDFFLIPSLLVAHKTSEISWSELDAYNDIVDKKFINTNARVEANWRRSYEVINTLNRIVDNIAVVKNEQNKILGEVLAMRGIVYFEMVRLWGQEYDVSTLQSPSIPLMLVPIYDVVDIQIPTLATTEAVYTQIEDDLTKAASLLKEFSKNEDWLSYYACQAYLMRIAMHKEEYIKASLHADTIIGSNLFELAKSPLEEFNNLSNSSEDIFAIQQSSSRNSGDINTGTGITYSYSAIEGLGALRITNQGFKDSKLPNRPIFANTDLRGTRSLDSLGAFTPDSIKTAFYRNYRNPGAYSPAKFSGSDRVIPVLRLAEVFLTRAEAVLRRDNAISDQIVFDLNKTRKRAGIDEFNLNFFTDPLVLMDSIKAEKKKEFLFEGIILHDLRRWDDPVGSSGLTGRSSQLLLPIPRSECDTSPGLCP